MKGDWQTRKRLKSSDSSDCSSASSSSSSSSSTTADQIIAGDPADEDEDVEQPFAFASHRRCRLACCVDNGPATTSTPSGAGGAAASAVIASAASAEATTTLRRFSMSTPNAVFFLPPPCEVAWFSGICAAGGQRHTGISFDDSDDDDDDDGDTSADESTEVSSLLKLFRGPLSLLAHESEIDDCLKCIRGGYLHFRVSVTDSARKMQGAAIVERTGGDMLRFESIEGDTEPQIKFLTTQSFAGAETVTPLIERFFPSVLRRLSDAPDRQELLAECVVCFGELTFVDLPMHSQKTDPAPAAATPPAPSPLLATAATQERGDLPP